MLAPSHGGLAPPPMGNPGSAPVFAQNACDYHAQATPKPDNTQQFVHRFRTNGYHIWNPVGCSLGKG